jgi:hypothetical protein
MPPVTMKHSPPIIFFSTTSCRSDSSLPASILGHYRIAGGAVVAIADCGGGEICGRIVVPGAHRPIVL